MYLLYVLAAAALPYNCSARPHTMRKPPAETASVPETLFFNNGHIQKMKFDLQSSPYDEKTGDLQHKCLHCVRVCYAPSCLLSRACNTCWTKRGSGNAPANSTRALMTVFGTP